MNFKVRKATPRDMHQVLELIKELAEFEKEPNAVIINEQDLIKDGFEGIPKFECFVAETTYKIVGMALFYPRYSTWKGQTIHLEDLIVSKTYRNKGVGKALFNKVIKQGYENNSRRIEWVVLDWNQPAIEFYKQAGATILNDWQIVQMDENAIKNYLSNTQK